MNTPDTELLDRSAAAAGAPADAGIRADAGTAAGGDAASIDALSASLMSELPAHKPAPQPSAELAVTSSQPAAPAPAATTPNLTVEQRGKALALAKAIETGGLAAVHGFGREIGRHTAEQTDQVLEQVRGADLDAIGGKLSEIVGVAQSLNLSALSGKRSKLPLLGPLIDAVRLKGSEVVRQFQDVRTQIDTLVGEVDLMQSGLAQRIDALDEAFESVKAEHALLEIHIVAGDAALGTLRKRLAGALPQASDPLRAQALQDLRTTVAALEKRVADMRMLQHAALQQLPMIRMVQANNRMLIEKFHTIRELTVPAWKRQFMLALSLNEQKNAVALANTIDDATNLFLKENARMLKDNTVATARANQRMVIDVETLREVHDTLLATVQEVLQVNREGAQQRASATGQLQAMRQAMAQQLTMTAR